MSRPRPSLVERVSSGQCLALPPALQRSDLYEFLTDALLAHIEEVPQCTPVRVKSIRVILTTGQVGEQITGLRVTAPLSTHGMAAAFKMAKLCGNGRHPPCPDLC